MKKRLLMLCALLLFSWQGQAAPPESLAPLVISEVFASGAMTAVDGEVTDWVELYNPGPDALDLADYFLSDQALLPQKLRLRGQLLPGEYFLLPMKKGGPGFGISHAGETLRLTDSQGVLQGEVSFSALPYDSSWCLLEGRYQVSFFPTPGAKNQVLTQKEAEEKRFLQAREQGIVLSEVMAANAAFLPGVPNEDWVELLNLSDRTIPLHGLYLTTRADDLTAYAFPAGTRLLPGARALVLCAGEAIQVSGRGVFANPVFQLDKSRGAVLLTDGEQVLDGVSWDSQLGSVAYGRPEGQGAFYYFNEPTPLMENPQTGLVAQLDTVAFSREGGFVEEPFLLHLTAQEGASIRYTLDGSEPKATSTLYEGPLLIENNQTVRAVAIKTGLVTSPLSSHTFLMEEQPKVAVLCLSGEPATFFGARGIFSEGNENLVNERRVGAEFYQGGEALRVTCGLRLTGGTSSVFLPRAFTLYARSGLSSGRFLINPFLDRPYLDYDALTVRGGGSDSGRTRFRDAFLCSQAKGYGLMYLASAPCVVYVNGAFYGVMELRERANQAAIAQWEGIADKEVYQRIPIIKNRGVQQQGSRQELEALAAFVRGQDLNSEENLAYVESQLDIDNLFAHTAFELICGNGDLGNVRYYRVPGGKWKTMLFDLDLGMLNTGRYPLDFYLGNGKTPTRFQYGELFQALMQVSSQQERFFTLLGRILEERFTPEIIGNSLDAWQAIYEPLFARHDAAWRNFSMKDWDKALSLLRKMCLTRPALVIKYVSQAYGLSDQEVQRYFGGFLQGAHSAQP